MGSYLNVHEGPHGIGFRIAYNSVPLKKGMTVTNEPGYYEDGKFGIRIENILLIKDAPSSLKTFGNIPYLAFQNVTMVILKFGQTNTAGPHPHTVDQEGHPQQV